MNNQAKNDKSFAAMLWLILGVFGRILPHPSNITPMTSLALFGGTQLSRGKAFAVTLASLIVSDILLSKILGYTVFGTWSFFTYTGFAAIVFAGGFLRKNPTALRTGSFTAVSSVAYWLWTNLGVWMMDAMYPRTVEGLGACYVAALPFLRNALVGDLVWTAVIFGSFALLRKTAPKYGIQIQGA